jgi:hypothetical protein
MVKYISQRRLSLTNKASLFTSTSHGRTARIPYGAMVSSNIRLDHEKRGNETKAERAE